MGWKTSKNKGMFLSPDIYDVWDFDVLMETIRE